MGKTLALAREDFNRRFSNEARRQFLLFKAPLNSIARSKPFLNRSFHTKGRWYHKAVRLVVGLKSIRSSSSTISIENAALGVWDRARDLFILIETGSPLESNESGTCRMYFKDVPKFLEITGGSDTLRKRGFEVVLQVWSPDTCHSAISSSPTFHQSTPRKASNAKSSPDKTMCHKHLPKLTRGSWNALINGDQLEWTRWRRSNEDSFVSEVSSSLAAFVIDVSANRTSCMFLLSNTKDQDICEVTVETVPRKTERHRVCRQEWAQTQGGPFGKALSLESLSCTTEMEFHFAFGEGLSLRRIQRASNGRCIFCNQLHLKVQDMVVHLAMDHSFGDWDFQFSIKGGLLCVLVTNPLVPAIEWVAQSATLPRPRRYVHSDTCEPLMPYEMDEDSENDVDENWIHERTEMLIDQFEDVAEEEIQLMKFWNRHVRCFSKGRIITDLSMEGMCESFVRDNSQALRRLRKELLIHFLNLWDSGLMTKDGISKCMAYLDD